MATNAPVSMDTLISVKITYQGTNKKFKVPLGELGPLNLSVKLRELLSVPEDKPVTFERFSDSAGTYITLDQANTQAYKTLYRAAKAKLKLRLRATSPTDPIVPQASSAPVNAPLPNLRNLKVPISSLNLNPTFSASEATLNNPAGGVRVSAVPTTRLAEKKPDADEEAPVPRPFAASHEHFFSGLADITRARDLALRMKESPLPSAGVNWSVYCNCCDAPMPDDHYHCNICDDGDYDLCQSCVSDGKHCFNEKHWLIKRSVKDGKVVNSTTERIAAQAKLEVEKKMPGAFAETEEKKPETKEKKPETEEKKPETEEATVPTRTCNSCVKIFNENEFLTCHTCEDFDLCISCHNKNQHGHHPAHAFKPAVEGTKIGPLAEHLAPAGRNVYHNALCDNCDAKVYGVRHKCLDCPDWDYCTKCFAKASTTHPGHRFATVYEPIAHASTYKPTHIGIYCDGPLCAKIGPGCSTFIQGVRYKCAICHDTDFCASCEATPSNKHNRTHPLIKFKTPVRNVSVTTMGEDKNGSVLATMGDNTKVPVRVQVSSPAANTVSKVQPIVDVKPADEPTKLVKEKIEIKDLLAEPIKEKLKVGGLLTAEKSPLEKLPMRKHLPRRESLTLAKISGEHLNAHFVRDTIADGTRMMPNQRFIQIWTLKNPGPHAWPAGCRVRYVGGDNMLNVEESIGGIVGAAGSNSIRGIVNVGEEVHFRVTMKAPQRAGTSISYWRLKSPDSIPFGHRLWCHIDVAQSQPITPAQALEPAATPADSSKSAGEDKEMFRLLSEFNKKRQLMDEAIRMQEQRVKELEDTQKRKQKQTEDEDRAKRVQMLRALHAARLAAVSAEKKDAAANVKPIARSPPAPTVEDVPEKEEVKVDPELSRPEPSSEPEVKPEADVKSEPELKAVPEVKEDEAAKSTMIFPQLEKESPVSSTHEAGVPSSPATAVTARSELTSVASPTTEEPEIFEDAESVSLVEESSSDDGFLTDEEYDILDASDEELV